MSKTPYHSPEELEEAFYEVLATGDADRLIHLWAEDEETLCVHPTGIRLGGLTSIRDSWQSIFANNKIRVEPELVAHWQGSMLAIHHLTEFLYVGDDPNPHGPLHVTHVYVRGAHGWRLVSRHASPADDHQQAMLDTANHTIH